MNELATDVTDQFYNELKKKHVVCYAEKYVGNNLHWNSICFIRAGLK